MSIHRPFDQSPNEYFKGMWRNLMLFMGLAEGIGLGIYLGILTGMFTALLVFGLAFTFQYVAGVAFPANTGLMIGLGAAGLQGGLMRLMRDPAMLQSSVIITALLVVLLITAYSQKRGVELAKKVPPKTVVFNAFRNRRLSKGVVKRLGRFGKVTITVPGEVLDMEGYAPLTDDLRNKIATRTWQFPADLPLSELERRLQERLQIEFNVADVNVSINARGEATISAAPPASGLSQRVPPDKHAIGVEALVPTGVAFGDRVTVEFEEGEIDSTVMSVVPPEVKEKIHTPPPPTPALAQTAAGGEARVGIAVDRTDVAESLSAKPKKFHVQPRGNNREYELITLLRRHGNNFRRVEVTAGSPFAGMRLGGLGLRAKYGVSVLALKHRDTWTFAPRGSTVIQPGDDLFVTGPGTGINEVTEALA